MSKASKAAECALCGAKSTQRCSRCREVFYCTEEHQYTHWRAHKNYCGPPSTISISAIFIPADEDSPREVTVKCTATHVGGSIFYNPDLESFLGTTDIGGQRISRMGYNGPKLTNPITCYIRDNFNNDGSPFNKCALKMTGGRTPLAWRGNVLAMKHSGLYPDKLLDVKLDKDLDAIVEYFKWYPNKPA
ncbi:hypothetical protein BV22DRAFT_849940 [Leucogyrophana mollusca]|uniref:Uncharacterized protein n=1 Tax=Leucogyrophana mollusca TaxID=85980 RepID=A0ACB8B315_9AGAM|nr:hypothetical protein BV22DRAFT_849940 [Leucogyrophana mollusca]